LPLSLSSAAVQPAVYREGVDLEAPALVLKYEAALQAIHNNNANLAAKAEVSLRVFQTQLERLSSFYKFGVKLCRIS
jgi:hypothetical protein